MVSQTNSPTDQGMEIENNSDWKYCGEYFTKNREKRDGHTYKARRDFHRNHSVRISRKDNARSEQFQTYNQQANETGITEIDDFFDEGFCKLPPGFRWNVDRSFNRPEIWDNVEDILLNNAVKIKPRFHRYSGICEYDYEIPIIGHMIHRNNNNYSEDYGYGAPSTKAQRKNKFMIDNWYYFRGKLYDPHYLYLYTPLQKELRKVCNFLPNNRYDPQLQKGKRNESKLNCIAISKMTKTKQEYIEIDLGQIYEITNIGTLGGYPSRVRPLSSCYDVKEEENGSLSLYKRNMRTPLYVVTSDSELCWVTKYRISYKDIATKKWRHYSQPLTGNRDISTEVIQNISILTRSLRIIPLEYHNAKSMRVLVYGQSFSSEESLMNAGKAKVETEGIETITYTIRYPEKKKVLDGYRGGCRCDYCLGLCNKKKLLKQFLRDELSSLDEHNRCSSYSSFYDYC